MRKMKKILVVDDDPDIRELTKKRLEQNQYAALSAANGREAVDICRDEKPDLVLLDIVMPRMDGYQTCKMLKEDREARDIPILFVTASDLDASGIDERHRNLGACGYISKPASFEDILKKIREALAGQP